MSKILVAEDNTANLELIREILQLHGFGLFHQADSLLAVGGFQNLVAVHSAGQPYFAGAGCGVALGVEKFTFGT